MVEESLYRVQEGSPRLISTTFNNGLPAGIERVEYEINLGGWAQCGTVENYGEGIGARAGIELVHNVEELLEKFRSPLIVPTHVPSLYLICRAQL